MRTPARVAWSLLAFTVAAGLLVAAGPPLVALRVDLEPVEARGEVTALGVVVQVAPEDRARLGASAWVELELRRGRETVDRVSRAVEVDAQGRGRLEVLWLPGSYELDVEIRSARGDTRGLWSDRVTVPALGPVPEPMPEPVASEAATPPHAEEPAAEPIQIAEITTVEAAAVPEPTTAPAPTPEPLATAPAPRPRPEAPTPEPAPPRSEAPGETVGVTVLVTRLQRPVASLGRETLSLKVDGDAVPVVALEGTGTAPLSLALAVDLSSSMAPHLAELGRLLGQLTLQVTSGNGSVSLVVAEAGTRRALDWGAGPDAVVEALRSSGSEPRGDLAGMVTAAFTGLTNRPGRRLLLVVTDGGDTADRDGWRRAEEAAVAAAAPVLVVELPGLEGRPAAALDRLVDACGGERFAAPTDEVLGTVLRHYGDLLEATCTVRFQRPAGTRSGPMKVRISTADDTLEVRHPKQVR